MRICACCGEELLCKAFNAFGDMTHPKCWAPHIRALDAIRDKQIDFADAEAYAREQGWEIDLDLAARNVDALARMHAEA